MEQIPSDSVDYIFTDPPYGGAVQYAELNFVWESWLGLNTEWHEEEIIVNHTRNKSLINWAEMMFLAMAECYRVLKPGRALSLCWHDASATTWRHLQDIMTRVGFTMEDSDSPLFIDTGSNTYNQRVTDKVVKRDLVINFRKPRPGESRSRPHTSQEEHSSLSREGRQHHQRILESSSGIAQRQNIRSLHVQTYQDRPHGRS